MARRRRPHEVPCRSVGLAALDPALEPAVWSLLYNAGGDQPPVKLVAGLEPFPQRRLIVR